MIEDWKVYERGGVYRIGIPIPDPFQRFQLDLRLTWWSRRIHPTSALHEKELFETSNKEQAFNVLADIESDNKKREMFIADHWKEV